MNMMYKITSIMLMMILSRARTGHIRQTWPCLSKSVAAENCPSLLFWLEPDERVAFAEAFTYVMSNWHFLNLVV